MIAFLVDIFCQVDDFCNHFNEGRHYFLTSNSDKCKRKRACRLALSEVMTIVILFHLSGYRTFKDFYLSCVLKDLRPYFPSTVSYSRFVQLIPHTLMPLTIFFSGLKGQETGIYFVDSTVIEVCHIKREKRNKVFKGLATKGKSSMGWFYGFKLHLVINNLGEVMSARLTKANTDDRKPVPDLVNSLSGWLFGDKGYLGKDLIEKLKQQSVDIFTRVRKNMEKRVMNIHQEFFLGKRGLIETVNDQLKNICQIQHTRHRSPTNAFVNLMAGLIAYFFRPRKPSIKNDKLNPDYLSLMSN